MPDLGKYATEVMASYAVSLVLIVALVAVSVWRARSAKAALDAVEARIKRNG